jgi:hypothetical protein
MLLGMLLTTMITREKYNEQDHSICGGFWGRFRNSHVGVRQRLCISIDQ